MNSLREIVELSPRMRGLAMHALREEESPQPLGPSRWDWRDVRKILLVRLRSIGDTVLATPSLFALKRFLPQAQVDILLEDWVAPVLSGYVHADNVITLQRNSVTSRALVARKLRAARYDVVYNLHGGTTSTILTRASGAKHRVGYASYQYARLHNQLSPSPLLLWGREKTHSVEQQLALLGWTGVPVSDGPPTQLGLTAEAVSSVKKRLVAAGLDEQQPFALVHPAAAFATKQWGTDKFARIVEKLAERNIPSVALVAAHEALIRDEFSERAASHSQLLTTFRFLKLAHSLLEPASLSGTIAVLPISPQPWGCRQSSYLGHRTELTGNPGARPLQRSSSKRCPVSRATATSVKSLTSLNASSGYPWSGFLPPLTGS